MAIHHHHHHHNEQHNHNVSSLLDALYCDEESFVEQEEGEESDVTTNNDNDNDNDNTSSQYSFSPLLLLEQDLFWEDEELNSLFSKEKIQQEAYYNDLKNMNLSDSSSFSKPRDEAVEWMLKVNAHYGFSALTATLAVTYLDKFLLSFHFQREKPWMIQLVAVTCISLAAKVEETQVPLLLDLQVQDTKYVFEAKTIQRMELLVLSTLKWKMHPVTPLSFLDHIIRRLGLKTNLHWEFLRRCENLLLSLLLDSRFVGCLPSVLATATMLHVIDQIDKSDDGLEYRNQLLAVLKTSKEKVDECYNAILQLSNGNNYGHNNSSKRKYLDHEYDDDDDDDDDNDDVQIPGSPSGVIDDPFNSDASNDSWTVVGSSFSSEPVFKKSRKTQGGGGQNMNLSTRVIVGIVAASTSP